MEQDPTKIQLTNDPRTLRFRGITNHGNLTIDVPYMTEIVPGLWQGGCTAGLQLPPEIDNIVSLYPWERYALTRLLRSELYVTMFDATNQSLTQVSNIADWVESCTGTVLVHCQGGLNRSSLVVSEVLIRRGHAPDDVIKLLREKRHPACLCNPAFEQWVRTRRGHHSAATECELERVGEVEPTVIYPEADSESG